MTIDVYTATGSKKGTVDLAPSLFESPINKGLIHQLLMLQQSNRRMNIAHVKTRGEVAGSTKKIFSQKHTGRARRGPVRSPLLRGGGKTFGPRNDRNFIKRMPQKMRHAAIRSCLSLQAKQGSILALESYPQTIKTKEVASLLDGMKAQRGRSILFVLPEKHHALERSTRNIPGVKTVQASYLNAEDILRARHIVFLVDALKVAEEVFGGNPTSRSPRRPSGSEGQTALRGAGGKEENEGKEGKEEIKKTKTTKVKKVGTSKKKASSASSSS